MPRLTYSPGAYPLTIRRSATGLGLFAEQDIPKGACLIEYIGKPITKEQEERSNSRYLFEISARKCIDGAPRWNTARYINHSCSPNCEPNIYKSRIYIHAKRKIKAGEELAYDYGKAYFDQMLKGVCGCPKCKPAKAKRVLRAVAARMNGKKLSSKKKMRKRA